MHVRGEFTALRLAQKLKFSRLLGNAYFVNLNTQASGWTREDVQSPDDELVPARVWLLR